jgi:hypothetical protein
MHYVFATATQFQKLRSDELAFKPSSDEHEKGFKDHNAPNQGNFSSGVIPTADIKIKRNQLLSLPKNWHQLQLHPHREGLLAAIHKKLQTMLNKGVWKKVNQQKNFGRLLPFM